MVVDFFIHRENYISMSKKDVSLRKKVSVKHRPLSLAAYSKLQYSLLPSMISDLETIISVLVYLILLDILWQEFQIYNFCKLDQSENFTASRQFPSYSAIPGMPVPQLPTFQCRMKQLYTLELCLTRCI